MGCSCANSVEESNTEKKKDLREEFEIEAGRMDIVGVTSNFEEADDNNLLEKRLQLANTDKISNYYKVEKRIGL